MGRTRGTMHHSEDIVLPSRLVIRSNHSVEPTSLVTGSGCSAKQQTVLVPFAGSVKMSQNLVCISVIAVKWCVHDDQFCFDAVILHSIPSLFAVRMTHCASPARKCGVPKRISPRIRVWALRYGDCFDVLFSDTIVYNDDQH